jgi:NADH-quinone oxidoreductase subunit G
MPLGFKTGGGVIFGNSGGVAEAVLRNVLSKENSNDTDEFAFIRGEEGIREANLKVGDKDLRLAVVYGLGNARKVIKQIKNKEKEYDLIEVMACPGGCIGGAGQPVYDKLEVRNKRTKCLYENDSVLELHKPQDNPYVQQVYKEILGAVGGKKAHEILHTFHVNRRRITEKPFLIQAATDANSVKVNVCFGTGCMLRGSQKILKSILDFVEAKKIADKVEVKASFCFERCSRGPVVSVGSTVIEQATPEKVQKEIAKNVN